jgi:HSP20 family molecular chaperone IbpA
MNFTLIPKNTNYSPARVNSYTVGSTRLDAFSPLDLWGKRWSGLFNEFDALVTPTFSTSLLTNPWKNKDDSFVYETELPRFKSENLDVSVEGGILHIRAEQESLRYYNSVNIPSDLDTGTVEARLDHGVLYITAKRKEEAKAKKIQIQTVK